MVRMLAATKRAKPDSQGENKRLVPRMLKGNDARNPRSVPANDISTVSQSAALAVGRIPMSGGIKSRPRMPKLRKPRASRSQSKNPRWPSTASRKSAVAMGKSSVDFTGSGRFVQFRVSRCQ